MTNHKPFEYVTMSFRVFGVHSELIHRAAALKQGRSTASYMRQIVCEQAAKDLGEPVPDYTALSQGPSQIAQAAAELGMDPKDFAAYAVRAYAAEVVAKRDSDRPPAPSPPRASSKSGQHAIRLPHEVQGRSIKRG